jgi:AcrR family transcriptional regulator
MENVKPKLTHRQRQALATQQLIVETARDLFLEQGYAATTIEAISTAAGVAVSTVYAIFSNKRGILRAIREAWHQDSGQRAIYQQAAQEADPARRIELAAHATRHQWEAGAAMIAIYRGAAAADKEAAAELDTALQGRRSFLKQFLDAMIPMLRPDLHPEQAAAVLRALTLAEVYRELVDSAGWSPDEYESWLADTLKRQLLPD